MPKKKPKPGTPAKPKKKIDKTISEAQRNNPRNPLQLTNDLAQHIAVMWTHNLTDEVIYTSLGIPHKTFYGWLKENRLVSITIRLGDKTTDITLGFEELKQRMKSFFEPGYLMRLEHVIDKSEEAGDYRTASSNLRWVMGKRLPKKYGREADSRIGSEQVEAICNAIFSIIFKHVKDPEILGKIQDDLDKMKAEEELKLQSELKETSANHPESTETMDQDNLEKEDSNDTD